MLPNVLLRHSLSRNLLRIIRYGIHNAHSSTLSDAFYNSEQKELQKTVKNLIDREINPYVQEWEKSKQFPASLIMKKFGDAGLLGISKPIEYGGLGLSYKYHLAFVEALSQIRAGGVKMGIMVQTDLSTPALSKYGSEKLKEDFLTPAITGDMVTCLGVSEPSAGSDVAGMKTRVVRKGNDLIINGQKMWITNSFQADWMCMLASTSEGHPHRNKSLIIVPMNEPGVIKAQKIEKLGMHCSDTGLIFFEDVRVPASYIIGEKGKGFTYQMEQFQVFQSIGTLSLWYFVFKAFVTIKSYFKCQSVQVHNFFNIQDERLAVAAGTLMSLQNSLNDTVTYTRTREAFKQPILSNQYVHFKLAELQTEIELFRALTYETSSMMERGEDVTLYASMLKLKAGRLQREVTDTCLQFWGGMGYSDEVPISRAYRDGRLASIAGGADEVMLGIISKLMGILPSKQ